MDIGVPGVEYVNSTLRLFREVAVFKNKSVLPESAASYYNYKLKKWPCCETIRTINRVVAGLGLQFYAYQRAMTLTLAVCWLTFASSIIIL